MSDAEALSAAQFERIVAVLNEYKVRYVVIGALGAVLQGVELPRSADVDITPASDSANKSRLARALKDLDARLRVEGTDELFEIALDRRTFEGMITMTFWTRFGALDVSFIPDGTTGFDDLARDARTIDRFGVSIPVASVQDITRSKRAAGRPKDAEHLPILVDFLDKSLGKS